MNAVGIHGRQPWREEAPWARHPPLDGQLAQASHVELAFWTLFILAALGGFAHLGAIVEKAFWIVADALAVLYVLRNPDRYLDLAARATGYMLLVLLAIISALWSLAPFVSVYHGVQLGMTILVGVVMAARLGVDGLMRAVFIATAVAAIMSALLAGSGRPQALMFDGAWMGVFTHKNSLGLTLTILIYTSAALALRRVHPIAYALVAAAALAMLPLARSVTSLMAAAIVLAGFAMLVVWRRGPAVMGLILALMLAFAAVAALYVAANNIDLVDLFFDATGKDATLTGRTILWQFAWEAIERSPILGAGFKGYWESYESSRLYLQYVIQQQLWFFHNNYLEVAVAFGLPGLALFLSVLASTYWRIARRFFADPDYGAVWCMCLSLHIFVSMLSENPLVSNHSLPQALLVACYVGMWKERVVQPRLGPRLAA